MPGEMHHRQFAETVRRMPRVDPDSPASRAAYKVLVLGLPMAQAAREEKITRQTVRPAVLRIREAYKKHFGRD